MNDVISKILVFTKTHRRVILPLIPLCLLFFGVLFFNFGSPQKSKPNQPTNIPTQTVPQTQSTTQEGDSTPQDWYEDGETSPEEETLGFQKRETLTNGNVLYMFTPTGSARPRITILSPDNQLVFRRIPATNEFPLPTLGYIVETYGEPQITQTIKTIYGEQTTLYFYTNGLAYLGNGQTGEIFEYQTFSPTSFENYMRTFSNLQ